MKKLPLSELIAKIGDANIRAQPLDMCATHLSLGKGGVTKVTFGTEVPFGLNGLEKFGLVLWIDRAQIEVINSELRASNPNGEPNVET